MLLTGNGYIKKCTAKCKPAQKEGQSDFDYFLIDVVGMGFSETIFSLEAVEPTEKEVKITLELKNSKLSYVSHK